MSAVAFDKGRNRNRRGGKGGGGTWGPGGKYNPDGYGCLLGLPLSPLWALAGFARAITPARTSLARETGRGRASIPPTRPRP